SSDQMLQRVARGLDIPARDIGIAGKKDKKAVTRQYISVPRAAEDRVSSFEEEGVTILSASAHTNKLSIGHSRGNRFKVVIRNLAAPDPLLVEQIVGRIGELGFPNFYGTQRFGAAGDTAEIGFKFLKGEAASLSKQWQVKTRKKFAISAAQSFLFNHYLLRRLIEKGTATLMAGDVVFKNTGGIFRVEDLETEQKRFLAGEIVPAGPIFGKKTYPAAEEALAFEETILSDMGIDKQVFSEFGKLMLGTRRAIYCRPVEFSYQLSGNDLQLAFTLPAGSYATVLLAEFMNSRKGI
ncbi:MAG: tRNA pseudouridine(13) synthase TruD, partial [bacterium]